MAAAIHALAEWEVTAIGDCLHAAAYGPFFVRTGKHPDMGDFHPIFGLWLDELRTVADAWPNTGNLDPETVDLAVNNSMNNLLGYPHGQIEAWKDFIAATPEEVASVLRHWAQLMGRKGGIR